MPVNLQQAASRFGSEDGSESTHGWLAAPNVPIGRSVGTTFFARIMIQEAGGTASADLTPQWQYSKNGAAFTNITTSSSNIKAVTTAIFSDQSDATNRLGGSGTFVTNNDSCTHDGLTGGANNDVAASGHTETVCALQLVTADLVQGDVLLLRINSLNTYLVYPQIVVTGAGSYIANPVNFDGTNDYLTRGAALTGIATGKQFTFSSWLRRTTTSVLHRLVWGGNVASPYILVWINNDGTLGTILRNSAGTVICNIASVATAFSNTNWHHVAVSVDLTDTGKRHIYVDGSSSLAVTTYTNDTIAFTTPAEWYLGASNTGANKYAGDAADLWFATEYIDLSVADNLAKFYNAARPVSLGTIGETPTGNQPAVFFSGPTGSWQYNRGSGLGFSVTGALTDGQALTASETLTPTTGAILFKGQTPTWATTSDFTASTTTGKITFVGHAATLQAGVVTSSTNGKIIFVGQTATWSSSASVTAQPITGALRFIGNAPTVDVGATIIRLSPNTLLASNNLQDSNLVSPPVRLADLSDEAMGSPGPDALWWTAVDEGDTEARVGFPSPGGTLQGTQTLNLWIRGTSLPCRQIKVELWEAGSKLTSEVVANVTSITGQLVTLTFEPDELSDTSGVDVELKVLGGSFEGTDEFNSLSLGESGENWASYFVGWNVRVLSGNSDEGMKCADGFPAATSGTIAQALAGYNGGVYGSAPFLHKQENGTLKIRCYAGCALADWGNTNAGIRPALYGYPAVAGMISQELSYTRGPYGYWKIRFRVNSLTKGMHWAWWLLSESGIWPPEIDIIERVDDGATAVGQNFHYVHKRDSDPDPTVIGNDFYAFDASGWHTYAMEITASWLIHRVDNVEVKRTQNVFTDITDWYLLGTWEIGGNWPGDPDGTTTWPGEVEIDYVRIYDTRADAGDDIPFSETWTGSNGDPWNTSRWTTPSYSSSSVADIQSNQGRLAPGGASYAYVRTDAICDYMADFELVASFTRSTTGEQYHTIFVRAAGQSVSHIEEPADCYAFCISDTGASTTFTWYEVTASTRGSTVDVAKTWGTGTWSIKIRCVGTSLRARAWQGAEPGTWDIDQTDATRIGGSIRFASVAGAAVTVRPILWDNLTITAL